MQTKGSLYEAKNIFLGGYKGVDPMGHFFEFAAIGIIGW